jgi:hypothetical protein
MIKLLELNSHREGFAWETKVKRLFFDKELFRGNLMSENKWYFDKTLNRFRYREEPIPSYFTSQEDRRTHPEYFYYVARRSLVKEIEIITKEAEEKARKRREESQYLRFSASNSGNYIYNAGLAYVNIEDGSRITFDSVSTTTGNVVSHVESLESRISDLESRFSDIERQNNDLLRSLEVLYSNVNSSLS